MSETPIFEQKNVLVTGGAGFIGSHLCEKLLKDAKVICLDDLSNSTAKNIEHLMQFENFEFIKHDINQPLDLERFPELEKFKVQFQGVQEIYHLACPTSAKNFDDLKMNTLQSNSIGVINALDLAVRYKAKFLYASSSVVYGPRPADGNAFEESHEGTMNHLSPRGCYDEGKRFGETCVATYEQVHGIDVKIARIFRTYGPRMKLFDGQMIPDFIVDALEGKDMVVYGDDSFTTSLMYVTDAVDGMTKLMKSGPGLGPVNFGGSESHVIVDVAQMIIAKTSSTSTITHEDPLPFMSPLAMPNTVKAKERLGWLPLVRLEDGLTKTIDYTIAHKQILGL